MSNSLDLNIVAGGGPDNLLPKQLIWLFNIGKESQIPKMRELKPQMRLHHIGIASENFEVCQILKKLLGCQFGQEIQVQNQGVAVKFTESEDAMMEVLVPKTKHSVQYPFLPNPIASSTNKNGTNFHHICFSVEDLDEFVKHCEQEGITLLPPGIQAGANGHRVAFLNPKQTNNLLLEFIEIS